MPLHDNDTTTQLQQSVLDAVCIVVTKLVDNPLKSTEASARDNRNSSGNNANFRSLELKCKTHIEWNNVNLRLIQSNIFWGWNIPSKKYPPTQDPCFEHTECVGILWALVKHAFLKNRAPDLRKGIPQHSQNQCMSWKSGAAGVSVFCEFFREGGVPFREL